MRYACIGPLLLLATPGIGAQYDRFINPCGFPPADRVDVTGDGVPDIVITSYRVGTGDEPSGGGPFAVLADPTEKRVRVLPGGTGPVDGMWIVR